MIWNWHAPSHWRNDDFHGFTIHARCKPKPKAKSVMDKIPESWVEDEDGKMVQEFRKQPHISVAMDKAASWVRDQLPPEPTEEELKYEQKLEESYGIGSA